MRWLKEPLVVFLALGGLIFVLFAWRGGSEEQEIRLTRENVARLQDQWTTQMGRAPTPVELDALVAQWLREEIYYREAVRMGLDANDVIVRRRLVQKLQFLTEDFATAVAATDDELTAYFRDNAERYEEPTRYSFEHRYFSTDKRSDARTDAAAALTADTMPPGDPFMLQKSYAARSARQIANLFGTEFAEALTGLAEANGDAWQGPVPSAFGWHTVRLSAVSPAHLPPFEQVRDAVARDYTLHRREEANDAYYESLKAGYTLVRESGGE